MQAPLSQAEFLKGGVQTFFVFLETKSVRRPGRPKGKERGLESRPGELPQDKHKTDNNNWKRKQFDNGVV